MLTLFVFLTYLSTKQNIIIKTTYVYVSTYTYVHTYIHVHKYQHTYIHTYIPRPIMLSFLPIMHLSNVQKFAYYTQYYAHDYSNYDTVCIWILLFLMTRLAQLSYR